jgi:hypothetical protein
MRAALTVYIFLLLTASAGAIDLLPEHRVHNIGNYCGWSSLESLANYHDIEGLKGLLKRVRQWDIDEKHQYVSVCYDHVMEEYLTRYKVPHKITKQWSMDRTLLEEYANTHGVAVALQAGNPHSIGCHMIVLTHYDSEPDGKVKFYDSSKPLDKSGKPKTWECGRGWFDRYWLGNACVIFRDKETTE